MFTIKWIDSDNYEHLYQGTDPRLRQRDPSRVKPDKSRDERAVFSYIDENKVGCSIDKGTVYVMNENGKTVATYHLTLLNSDAFPECTIRSGPSLKRRAA